MPSRTELRPMEVDQLLSALHLQVEYGGSAEDQLEGPVRFFPAAPYDPEDQVSQVPSEDNFCEDSYLKANPDLSAAIERGEFRSGFEHWVLYGRSEGRSFAPSRFDEPEYLKLNPEAASAVRNGEFESGRDHWRRKGRLEGWRFKKSVAAYISHLKKLATESQTRLDQIPEGPMKAATGRSALVGGAIPAFRRVLSRYEQFLATFVDITKRQIEQVVACLEFLGGRQEWDHQQAQSTIATIAARLERADAERRRLESRIRDLEAYAARNHWPERSENHNS